MPKEMDISATFVNEPVLCHTHEEHCSMVRHEWDVFYD